ncbi:MAG: ATPase [Treponema sp.]|jgi:hypothetical protein|nr:ATPase [Treponema sp.]
MEELQSPEVLEREILEDARRKAFKILKSADDAVKANTGAWEKKTADALAELERRYSLKRQESASEILARLPLDMRRIWSEKVEGFLVSAVVDWFGALKREQILVFLDRELKRRLAECPEFAGAEMIRAGFTGLSQEEAGSLVKKNLPGAAPVFENLSGPENGGRQGDYPELVLDIPAVRLTASIKMAVDSLLLNKRAELIEALLGPEALKGPGGLEERKSEGAQGD